MSAEFESFPSARVPSDAETYLLYQMDGLDWKPGVTKHDQTYRSFLAAARAGVEPKRALELVAQRLQASGAVINERDIGRQLNRAYAFVGNGSADNAGLPPGVLRAPDGSFYTVPKLPAFSHPKLKAVVAELQEVVDANWLRSRSPMLPEKWNGYLEAIYEPGEHVPVFIKFDSRSPWKIWTPGMECPVMPTGENGVWYLANPVDGQWRNVPRCVSPYNPEGRTCRAEECVTSFRFVVLESDHSDADYPGVTQDWLKFLALLPLRIVAVYTSAGKSVHALVRIDATSKADWDRQVREMKPFLIEHGADPGALSAVRLTRLPHAFRKGLKQELLFCCPDADGTPIRELPIVKEVR